MVIPQGSYIKRSIKCYCFRLVFTVASTSETVLSLLPQEYQLLPTHRDHKSPFKPYHKFFRQAEEKQTDKLAGLEPQAMACLRLINQLLIQVFCLANILSACSPSLSRQSTLMQNQVLSTAVRQALFCISPNVGTTRTAHLE